MSDHRTMCRLIYFSSFTDKNLDQKLDLKTVLWNAVLHHLEEPIKEPSHKDQLQPSKSSIPKSPPECPLYAVLSHLNHSANLLSHVSPTVAPYSSTSGDTNTLKAIFLLTLKANSAMLYVAAMGQSS